MNILLLVFMVRKEILNQQKMYYNDKINTSKVYECINDNNRLICTNVGAE
jgi:hypothetical protein